MFSSSRLQCKLACFLFLGVFASLGVSAPELRAQTSSSSASSPADVPAAQVTTAPMTVQQRIKARREQRRLAAIHDVYGHLYEAYVGAGYLRFTPGPFVQRVNMYSWNVGVTRYYSEHFGVTVDGRGLYGTPFVGLNAPTNSAITKPAISTYTAMAGPTYRFLLKPKFSVSGRVLAGGAFGKFSGDLGSYTTSDVGLYPNGTSIALSASLPVEYNVSSGLGVRLAPEYVLTNFGSTMQNSLGFTGGLVFRFGKQ